MNKKTKNSYILKWNWKKKRPISFHLLASKDATQQKLGTMLKPWQGTYQSNSFLFFFFFLNSTKLSFPKLWSWHYDLAIGLKWRSCYMKIRKKNFGDRFQILYDPALEIYSGQFHDSQKNEIKLYITLRLFAQ